MTLRALLRLDEMRANWERNHPVAPPAPPQSTLRLDPAAVRASVRGCVVRDGQIIRVLVR